jgi:hypothetical protein
MASTSLSAYSKNSTAPASGGPQNALAAGGVPPTNAPPVPLVSRFVVRFADTPPKYLNAYLDAEGLRLTDDLRDAKLFSNFTVARSAATLFHGDVKRVICTIDGRDVRAAIIESVFTDVLEGGEPEEKPTSATVVRGGGEETPRTFLAVRLPDEPPIEGRKLLFDFLSDFLGVPVFGVQPGFKHLSDVYLFQGPHGTTMSVPTNVMLLDRDVALSIIREKLAQKIKAFGGHR